LGGYENENLCEHENEEKKIDEETHIPVAKRDLTNSTAIESLRLVDDERRGRSRKSYK